MKNEKICGNCKYGDKEMLYCMGIGCGKTHNAWKSKEDAEVVEDIEKSCVNCKFTDCYNSTITECNGLGFKHWEPIELIKNFPTCGNGKDSDGVKKCDVCDKEGNMYEAQGVLGCSEFVTNSKGAKQSKIETAFSLVPHDSLLAVAKVMKTGSERYEKDNWSKLTTDEIYDHLMEHLVNWHMTGNMEDLERGVTRAMMLYSVANHGH